MFQAIPVHRSFARDWVISRSGRPGMKMGEEETGGNYLRAAEVAEAPAGEME